MLRILHVVTSMDRGGIETMLMNYYRHIDRSKLQFDFLEHRPYPTAYDDEIESLGGRIFRVPRLNPFSFSYRRALCAFFETHTEYQIVHCHLNEMSPVVLSVARKCGVRVRITHSHIFGSDKDWKLPLRLYFRRYVSSCSTYRLACSDMAGQWMFRGADFSVFNNAIDAGMFVYNYQRRMTMRKELDILENEFVLGDIGRFFEQKNHTF